MRKSTKSQRILTNFCALCNYKSQKPFLRFS
jgi:hypothetical protein